MKKNTVFIFIFITLFHLSFAQNQKQITLKGIYFPDTILNINASNSNYLNSGYKDTYDLDFTVNSVFGIGAEILAAKEARNNAEMLVGFTYMPKRTISWVKGTETLSGFGYVTYDGEVISSEIQTTSLYFKGRFLSEQPTELTTAMYVAGKLSYNLFSISGNLKNAITRMSDSIGYGFSLGAIVYDRWDMEFSFENMAAINNTITFDDGFDSLNGTFLFSTLSFSIGCRL